MRWREKKTLLKDDLGRKRKIEKFLWFPKCLPTTEGNNEWRWWEKANIIQVVTRIDVGGHNEWGNYEYVWLDIYWEKD